MILPSQGDLFNSLSRKTGFLPTSCCQSHEGPASPLSSPAGVPGTCPGRCGAHAHRIKKINPHILFQEKSCFKLNRSFLDSKGKKCYLCQSSLVLHNGVPTLPGMTRVPAVRGASSLVAVVVVLPASAWTLSRRLGGSPSPEQSGLRPGRTQGPETPGHAARGSSSCAREKDSVSSSQESTHSGPQPSPCKAGSTQRTPHGAEGRGTRTSNAPQRPCLAVSRSR